MRLRRRQRIEVWRLVEAFTSRLVERSERTYLQLADAAAAALGARRVKPYQHVIVDEAQDLHPAQWRMLRAAVDEHPNDLFIVGDTHQRIYDNRVTLSQVGINIRGRSHRLRLNYRTTHEILRWSLGLLRGEPFDDLEGGTETLAGYHSQMHGPAPTAGGHPSIVAELDALVDAVRAWIDADVKPGEIGVAARTNDRCADVVGVLRGAGIPAAVAKDSAGAPHDSVTVATMHAMKGHEYRCVAVVDVGADRMPLRAALTSEADDPVQHRHDMQIERCLLYVACTRARDDLRVTWSGKPSPFVAPLL